MKVILLIFYQPEMQSGAIVQWQDRQYVGAFWGQNQGIPHILSMSNPYPAHPHKISSFCLLGHY